MISLADFQPLSIAKVNIFHQEPRFYRQIYHSVKVHASEENPCVNYDLLIRCVRRQFPLSLTKILTLFRTKYFHINW